MFIVGKEGLDFGIAGCNAYNFMHVFEHPPQAVGAALFVFDNQNLHLLLGINGMVTQ